MTTIIDKAADKLLSIHSIEDCMVTDDGQSTVVTASCGQSLTLRQAFDVIALVEAEGLTCSIAYLTPAGRDYTMFNVS